MSKKKNFLSKVFGNGTNIAFFSIGLSFIILGLQESLYFYSGIAFILLAFIGIDSHKNNKSDAS